MPILPSQARACARSYLLRGSRRRDPRNRSRDPLAGNPLCRGVAPVYRRDRRRGLRGWETHRAPTRPSPACPSGIRGCVRGRASRWDALERGHRAQRLVSRSAPSAFDLRRPLVYLLAGENVFLDEQLLRRGDPALVVAELAVVLEALYGAAEFIGSL